MNATLVALMATSIVSIIVAIIGAGATVLASRANVLRMLADTSERSNLRHDMDQIREAVRALTESVDEVVDLFNEHMVTMEPDDRKVARAAVLKLQRRNRVAKMVA